MRFPLVIIDYGIGNIRSVVNAFSAIGCEPHVTSDPGDLESAARIVLPGVGAFGDCMANLRERNWIAPLEDQVLKRKKPFLGLCVGFQMLATCGTEGGHHEGLNWIPGVVEKLRSDSSAIRVPHIGWNDVEFVKGEGLYAGLGKVQSFYFVHSYAFRVQDESAVGGICRHGSEFAASVELGNIFGTQYHPEKSQKAGLAVLRNFLRVPSLVSC